MRKPATMSAMNNSRNFLPHLLRVGTLFDQLERLHPLTDDKCIRNQRCDDRFSASGDVRGRPRLATENLKHSTHSFALSFVFRSVVPQLGELELLLLGPCRVRALASAPPFLLLMFVEGAVPQLICPFAHERVIRRDTVRVHVQLVHLIGNLHALAKLISLQNIGVRLIDQVVQEQKRSAVAHLRGLRNEASPHPVRACHGSVQWCLVFHAFAAVSVHQDHESVHGEE
mmetsp:Transcript_61587/g.188143  ORF Transcript_61587/g.188143 Transcript_61587/m.188143 type:complete len:228 (+) Transcript_61587:3-686(+)